MTESFWILKSGAPIVGLITEWLMVDWESYVVLPPDEIERLRGAIALQQKG